MHTLQNKGGSAAHWLGLLKAVGMCAGLPQVFEALSVVPVKFLRFHGNAVKHTMGVRYGREETFEQSSDCMRMLSLLVAVALRLQMSGTNVLELRQAQQRYLCTISRH